MTTTKDQSDPDCLFVAELLTIHKVSVKSIYRWIESEKILDLKFGEHTYHMPARAIIARIRASGCAHC